MIFEFVDARVVSYFLIPLGAFAALLAVWLGDGLRYIFDDKVTDKGVQFMVFRVFPWRCIAFSKIKEVRRIGVVSAHLAAMNLKNRRAQTLRPVLLVKKSGWFSREFLLTPENPERFIESVQAHLALATKVID